MAAAPILVRGQAITDPAPMWVQVSWGQVLASAGWVPAITTIPAITTAITIPAMAIAAAFGIGASGSANGRSAAGGRLSFGASLHMRAGFLAFPLDHPADPEGEERRQDQD